MASAVTDWAAWINKRNQARTADDFRIYIDKWMREGELAESPVDRLTEDHVDSFVNPQDADAKLGTRKQRLSILRSFFGFLSAKGWIEGDPSRLVRVQYHGLTHEQKETKHPPVFTDAEFALVVDHTASLIAEFKGKLAGGKPCGRAVNHKLDRATFWWCATIISRCSGLRLGDVCQLEWATMAGDQFTVHTDKRDKRVVPHIWNEPLFKRAVASIPYASDTHCFPEAREIITDPKRRQALSWQFGCICERVGLSSHSFHGLRHTYATECHRAGIPTPHIAASMGHSDPRTTAVYIH